MRMLQTLLAATTAAVLAFPAQAATQFNFDDGVQGWTVFDGGAMTWQPGGGNPDGYLEISDASNGDFRLDAPVGSLGNWSGYLGGTLRFDARNIDGATPDWGGFGLVRISTMVGGNEVFVEADMGPAGEPAIGAGWKTYSVLLDTATWGASLPTVLANVTRLTIEPEFHAGQPELVGVDNIVVTAVPEPASVAMLLAGLGVVRWGAQKRRKA